MTDRAGGGRGGQQPSNVDGGHDALLMTFARSRHPDDPDVARAWPLLLDAFEHQGTPTANLATIIGMLDGSNGIGGWDEFGMEEVVDEPHRVDVWFIDQSAACDRVLLMAELSALRTVAGV
jgi:hypothetical protein